jgi:tRNA modification GTPase
MSPSEHLDSFGDPQNPDTICGLATPLGQGGLGVIRVSGPETFAVADQVFHGKHTPSETPTHRILFGRFADPATGNDLDEIVLSIFRRPNSYTGEDVVELSFHGSPAVLSSALDVLTRTGCRLARPGEFTFRAFSNGRIDLTQAEAVVELVNAKSEKSARAAYCQLQGSLKDLIGRLRSDVIEGLAWLEMSSDFVEEDLDFKKVEEIGAKLDLILEQVDSLANAYQRSRIVRDGLIVAIVGAPNAGKSSLFNKLLARERSIVTDIPGTTRDTINEYLILGGYPVCLIDTAGIRRAKDAVEVIGIDRTVRHLEDADLVFWVLDGMVGYSENDRDIRRMIGDRPAVALINKEDLVSDTQLAECGKSIDLQDTFSVSAVTGQGIEPVIQWLIENYLSFKTDQQTHPFIINRRHLDSLDKAKEHLELAKRAIARHESHEFAAFDVRKAADYLGEITGETTPDDVLNKIFADFCIGK